MKLNIFSRPSKRETARIEELEEKRRAARRLAQEMFLIRARADQNDKDKKTELERDQYERKEWDQTFSAIRQINNEFDR